LDGGETVPGFKLAAAELFDDIWLDDPDYDMTAR
jgi:hypothetical protein